MTSATTPTPRPPIPGQFRRQTLVPFERPEAAVTLTPSAGQFAPSRGQVQPHFPARFHLPLPQPASAPPSPEGQRRGAPTARAPRSLRPPLPSGSVSSCRAAAPRLLLAPPPSVARLPALPGTAGGLSHPEGSAERGGRGKPRSGRRRTLNLAARGAARGRWGPERPPARPLPEVPPPGRAPAAGQVSENAKGHCRFISLCAAAGGPGRRGWGPGVGAPRSRGQRRRRYPASGSRSRRPNFGRGARAPGEPRCAESPGVPGEPGWGVRRRRFPDPGPQEGSIPALPGGAWRPSGTRGPRCPQGPRCPRMPLALAGRPRARRSGPCGAPPSPAGLPEPG